MASFTIFQNNNLKGYKIELNGNILPEYGTYQCSSLTVGPLTELKIFDRNNELATLHNGTTKLCAVNKISDIITINSTTILTFKSYSIKRDDSSYIKKTQTNDVAPLIQTQIYEKEFLTFNTIILIILIGVGLFYYFTVFRKNKRMEEQIKNNINSH